MTPPNVLSEIVRVKIAKKTMDEAQAPLSTAKRRALRREAIMAYIRSKPAGEKIRMPEFAKIYGGSAANCYTFMKHMISDGLIEKHNIGIRTFYYTIPGDATLKAPVPNASKQTFDEILEDDGDVERAEELRKAYDRHHSNISTEAGKSDYTPGLAGVPSYPTFMPTHNHVEDLAKAFAWAYPDVHNDLREFIKWLGSQI